MGVIDAENKLLTGTDIVARGQPIGNQYAPKTLTSTDGTNLVTLLTGAPGYFLTNIGLQVDATCTIAVAGMVSLMFSDTSSGTIANYRWYLPAAFSPGQNPGNDRVINGPGFAWNNQVANSSLQVSLSVALTAGSIRFFARYANVSFLG